MKDTITESLLNLEKWVEKNEYKGYEPFDGNSSYLKPLTFNSLLGKRILQQLVRRSVINLRPILGIKPKDSTKGRGYMAWGYLDMYKVTDNKEYIQKAEINLEWLDKNKAPGFENHSWGNHFDFFSRGGRLLKHTPIIVWTSLIGQAYLDAYEILKEKKYLDIADSICQWIMAVPRLKTDSGTCLSYVAEGEGYIHNSNMLGAAMLARSAKILSNEEYLNVASEAMEYSCSRQLPDGAWWYAEGDKWHWIDNFHTGYNLDSLKCYIDHTGDKKYYDVMIKGLEFYMDNFFEESGRPKYYNNNTYPVDSQCISQSIETLAKFSEIDKRALELDIKVAKWAIENMQDKKGYFYFRQYKLNIKDKTPMLHWAQATTYKGLALLLRKLSNK